MGQSKQTLSWNFELKHEYTKLPIHKTKHNRKSIRKCSKKKLVP